MFSALKSAFNSIKEKIVNKEVDSDVKSKEPKVSISTKLKSSFSEKYFLSNTEIDAILDDLQMELLQADLSIEVSENIIEKLKDKIKSEGVLKSSVSKSIRNYFISLISESIKGYNKDFFISQKLPFVIMFLGTNGTGKTTSIAKLANYIKSIGKEVVISASDTYRAASIEQIQGHAKKLGVHVVSGKYGSDSASIAYDTIEYAKRRNVDFVLIDTAGRQDNNLSLIKELEKIKRVVKPDMSVFVSEALSGQSAIEQAKSFDKSIGFDTFALTKVDVDEKGGTLISIGMGLEKPVLFLGVGQEYKDIVFYSKDWIEKILK